MNLEMAIPSTPVTSDPVKYELKPHPIQARPRIIFLLYLSTADPAKRPAKLRTSEYANPDIIP